MGYILLGHIVKHKFQKFNCKFNFADGGCPAISITIGPFVKPNFHLPYGQEFLSSFIRLIPTTLYVRELLSIFILIVHMLYELNNDYWKC